MFNAQGLITKASLTKDLVVDQTTADLIEKLNTSGLGFDVTEGYGDAAATSSAVLIALGGFADQKIVASLKYAAPTAQGSEDIGVILRCTSMDSPDIGYYYCRVDGGTARITRVTGSFTTLASGAFALPPDTLVTITAQAVGNQISATFDAGGAPATVNLNATDSGIPARGVFGFRSLTSAIWCRSFTAEQL